MIDFNLPLAGLVVRITGVSIFIIILILQIIANKTHQDEFTKTRILLTMLISGIIIFTSPSIAYLIIRSLGGESDVIRAISTVAGAFSFIFTAVLLLIVYLQKIKKEK